MLLFAFLIALVVTVVATLLDLVYVSIRPSRYDYRYDRHQKADPVARNKCRKSTFIAAPIVFGLLWLFDWVILYTGTPVFSGVGWWQLMLVDVAIVVVGFGIANGVTKRVSLATAGVAAACALFAFFGMMVPAKWVPLKDSSNVYGHIAHVKTADTSQYPPTDDNHMVVVSYQNALNKAHQAMNQDLPHTNTPIGSRYNFGDCALQSVDGHMYYICDLRLTAGTNNNKAMHYIVPGYIVVDAEDINPTAKLKLGYQMRVSTDGPFGASIKRFIWSNGYSGYYVDDLTLEVNDQWQPFYTASIDQPGVRWQQSVPKAMIMVDPQKQSITKFDLGHIPSWVDRIYSADMAKKIMNWWGDWGRVKWSVKGNGNRLEVDGDVDLVYTTKGPAWQALMTSMNNDTAISYIALMDTRGTDVMLYKAPEGLLTQATVTHDIVTSPHNLKGLKPAVLALHEIYGQLTWVAPLVPSGTGSDEAASSAGLALLNAQDPNGTSVVIGTGDNAKSDALSQYNDALAEGDNNTSPEANSHKASVDGTIAHIDQFTSGGDTIVVMMLAGDTDHMYRMAVQNSDFGHLSVALAQKGDAVTLVYRNNENNPVRNVSSFTDRTLSPTH